MKLISSIYDQYQIMPNLQVHMYRVAAVASLIADHFDQPLERNEIVSACLLHDMGNIIKFDLGEFPEFVNILGRNHWEKIKDDFTQKYGQNEHEATLKIAQEIGVSDRTLALIQSVSFAHTLEEPGNVDMAGKVSEYCDLRVTPHGVTSLAERWTDLRTRYGRRYDTPEKLARLEKLQKASETIQDEIFSHCSIRPNDITEASASETIASLHDFAVS